MGFSRQECWGGLPFPPPGDLPDPGMEPACPASAGGFFTAERPGEPTGSRMLHKMQILPFVWTRTSQRSTPKLLWVWNPQPAPRQESALGPLLAGSGDRSSTWAFANKRALPARLCIVFSVLKIVHIKPQERKIYLKPTEGLPWWV